MSLAAPDLPKTSNHQAWSPAGCHNTAPGISCVFTCARSAGGIRKQGGECILTKKAVTEEECITAMISFTVCRVCTSGVAYACTGCWELLADTLVRFLAQKAHLEVVPNRTLAAFMAPAWRPGVNGYSDVLKWRNGARTWLEGPASRPLVPRLRTCALHHPCAAGPFSCCRPRHRLPPCRVRAGVMSTGSEAGTAGAREPSARRARGGGGAASACCMAVVGWAGVRGYLPLCGVVRWIFMLSHGQHAHGCAFCARAWLCARLCKSLPMTEPSLGT